MNDKLKYYLKRLPFYLIGMNIISIGVVLIARAENIGAGGWDAVNINLTHLVNIDLGTASMVVNAFLLTILIIYRRDFKHLLIIGTIILLGFVIKLYDKVVFINLSPETISFEALLFAIGIIIIPLGLSLVLFSKYPSMIFDQITYMLMDIFKSNSFSKVRIGFEIFSVVLAIIIAFLAKLPLTVTGIGAVGIGTIIASIILGPLINIYSKFLNKIFPMLEKDSNFNWVFFNDW